MRRQQPHIAILTPFLHHASGYGGITPWLVNLANGFVTKGATVDILVNAKDETPLSYEPLHPSIRVINQGYHKFKAFRELTNYLKSEHPTVLLTAGHRYNGMGAWAKVLSKTETKIFLSMHENLTAGSKKMKPWKRLMRQLGIRHLFPRTDGVISVSQGVADDLMQIGLPAQCNQVIYNPIVNDELIQESQQPVDHPWLVNKSEPVLLGVGRLEEQKDYPTLIKALAKVREHTPCRLIILGEGRDRAALQKLIDELGLSDSIQMPGHVSNPFAYMAKSDAFVLSSAWEGFGNVIAEALAVGTPAISTDCPSGPSEILENGKYGPLVPMKNPDALAKAILETLNNPLEKSILTKRGQEFSVESAVNHYWQYMIENR